MLWELYLWRGSRQITEKILDGLDHLALMGGLSSPRLAGFVAQMLWEMSFEYIGPEDVPMPSHGQKKVLRCLKALETLTQFNCEFGHGRKAMPAITANAQNFFEVALWYSNKRTANAVIDLYESGLTACEEEGNHFPYGRKQLLTSITKLIQLLDEQQPRWSHQRKRLEKLRKP